MDNKQLLAQWEHELLTNDQGMAHMAVNRVFLLKNQLVDEQGDENE